MSRRSTKQRRSARRRRAAYREILLERGRAFIREFSARIDVSLQRLTAWVAEGLGLALPAPPVAEEGPPVPS